MFSPEREQVVEYLWAQPRPLRTQASRTRSVWTREPRPPGPVQCGLENPGLQDAFCVDWRTQASRTRSVWTRGHRPPGPVQCGLEDRPACVQREAGPQQTLTSRRDRRLLLLLSRLFLAFFFFFTLGVSVSESSSSSSGWGGAVLSIV